MDKDKEIIQYVKDGYTPAVLRTPMGTPYLREPGIALIAQPIVSPHNMQGFLCGLGEWAHSYMEDRYVDSEGSALQDGDLLTKMMGQISFASFGEKRTKNVDMDKYLINIKEQGHFSVAHHANYTFFIYGISRSTSMELIRHKFIQVSQLSQRYVDEKVLRFVERPEFQDCESLHRQFMDRIDTTYNEYIIMSASLHKTTNKGSMRATDYRKRIQQAARAVLTNETETFLGATADIREWRHFLALRGSVHAEVEMRILSSHIARILKGISYHAFSDVEETVNEEDGYPVIEVKYHGNA